MSERATGDASSQNAWELRLFGAPGLLCGGAEVRVSPRKAMGLVAYLSVEGRPHARDELAVLMWPDAARSDARRNLRNLLWIVGRTLGDALQVEGDVVALRQDRVASDVGRFRACLARAAAGAGGLRIAPLQEAVCQARGGFLEGFSLPASEAFEGWREQQASTLRGEALRALGALASLHQASGDLAAAEAALLRLVHEEPYDDHAHAALIRVLAESGRPAAALKHFEAYTRILDAELGVEPGRDVADLARAVREGAVGSAIPVRARAAAGAEVRLVGRDAEWARLAAASGAHPGGGRVISIQGEAGIGKTALAERFVAHARSAGMPVLVCRCYEGEERFAYGPLADALERSLEAGSLQGALARLPEHAVGEISRLLPGVDAPRDGDPAAVTDGPRRFLDAVARLLHALLPGGVLLVDDAHWADAGTLELLAYLTRRLDAYPLTAVLAWRDESEGPGRPLPTLVAEARRRGRAEVLRLERLQADHVRELAARAGWSDDAARRLFEETEGLPLLVSGYLEAVARARHAGSEGAQDWSLPIAAQEHLSGRFRSLDDASRTVLLAVATLSRPADARLLAEVSGRDEPDVVADLEHLVTRGLLKELAASDTHGVEYAFGHGKLRDVAREQAVGARLELFHRRAARALADRAESVGSPLASQIALHHRLGGEPDEAARWHVRAAEYAASVYAHEDALEHLRSALELGAAAPADLHERAGDVEVLAGRYADALASFAAAERIDPARAPRIRHKVAGVHMRRGAWEDAQRALGAALPGIERERRSSLLADASLVALQLGWMEEASERAVESLREALVDSDRARALNHLGMLERRRGASESASRHFEEALRLTAERDPVRVSAMNNLGRLLAQQGDAERAERMSREALELCRSLGDRHQEAALHSNLADLLNARRDTAAAMRHLKASAAIYADIAREADEWRPEVWMLSEW